MLVFVGHLHISEALTDEEAEFVIQHAIVQCANLTKVNLQEAVHFLPINTKLMDNFSHDMKCYLLCFYRKINLIDFKDHPKHDDFALFMESRFEENKAKVQPALKKCLAIQHKDPCEEIYEFELCMVKNVQG
uniref:Uncharacterized protein n=1 Tax=Musca domestica TaxID=7370 RepID=A0A1I8NK83_MUSDO